MEGWLVKLAPALVAVAIAVPLLFALMIVLGAAQLRRLRWQPVTSRRIERHEMPENVRALLDGQRERLSALGFEHAFSEASDNAVVVPDRRQLYADVYRRADGRTWAIVAPHSQPTPSRPCVLYWLSLLPQGRSLMTMNAHRHVILLPPEDWTLCDDYLPSDEAALARHVERATQAGALAVDDAQEVFHRMAAMSAAVLPSLQARGKVSRTAEPQLHWPAALAMAWQVWRGQWRAARSLAPAAALAPPGDSPEATVQAYQQQRALTASRPWSRAGKWKAFAISALLFVLVGGLWSSWRFAAILLAVVALHEGGHYLAMRWTGYRNLSVFFLPGLGGLAMGEKPSATPLEKALVFLAGPVPGLLLAGAGLLALGRGALGAAPPWFTEFLLACALVNYLNLLPFVPLDGGRVVEALLFAKWPRLRFLFVLLGFAALATAGLALGDVALLVIATIIAIGLIHHWRVARVGSAVVRAPGEVLDEATAIERIDAALRRPDFARWTFAVRAGVVRSLLPDLQGRLPRPWETLAGLALYAACLLAPLAVLHLAAPQVTQILLSRGVLGGAYAPDDVEREPPAAPAPPSQPLEQRLAAADTLPLPERVSLMLEAADDADVARDEAARSSWIERATVLVEPLPRDDPLRTRVQLRRAAFDDDNAAARTRLEAVIADLATAQDAPRRLLRAEAHEQLGWTAATPAERLPHLQAALSERSAASPANESQLVLLRKSVARTLVEVGRGDEALALLRANLDALPLPAEGDRSRAALAQRIDRVQAETDLAWFFVDAERAPDARAAADRAVAGLPPKATISWLAVQRAAHEAQVWAHLVPPEPAGLRTAWARYDEVVRGAPFGGGLLPRHEIDRYLVAGALGDAPQQRAAAKALRDGDAQRVARLCDAAGPAAHRVQRERQTEAARQLGLCTATPAR